MSEKRKVHRHRVREDRLERSAERRNNRHHLPDEFGMDARGPLIHTSKACPKINHSYYF